MAKLGINEILEGGGGSGEFFTLKNDKESAVVRMLYKGEDELESFSVHEVMINGKKRFVDCLGTVDCPLCLANNPIKKKLFIQLIDDRDGKLKVWQRGRNEAIKLQAIINKYGSLFNRKFEIERHGKPNDARTEYMFFALDKDDVDFDSLPSKIELVGPDKLILTKTHDEMEALLRGETAEVVRPRETNRDIF